MKPGDQQSDQGRSKGAQERHRLTLLSDKEGLQQSAGPGSITEIRSRPEDDELTSSRTALTLNNCAVLVRLQQLGFSRPQSIPLREQEKIQLSDSPRPLNHQLPLGVPTWLISKVSCPRLGGSGRRLVRVSRRHDGAPVRLHCEGYS